MAVVIYGISVSTHRQQLLNSLHVTEVGGQAQRRVTRIRPDLEGCLISCGHAGWERIEYEWRSPTSTEYFIRLNSLCIMAKSTDSEKPPMGKRTVAPW